jgi:hypothetical protein
MMPARPEFRTEFIYATYPGPHEVAWYKWEFLRRNAQYRADYATFIDSFGKWFETKGFWYDEEKRLSTWTDSDEKYFYARIAPVIRRLCRKWQIGNPFPPEWKFSRKTGLRKVSEHREMFPPTSIAAELNWDFTYITDLVNRGFSGTADVGCRYGNLVRIEFDLDRPLKDLLKYAKYILRGAMENYSEEARELGLKIPANRRRFRDYDTHLKVWDLSNRGMASTKIVGLVSGLASAQNVQDHVRAARRLISGGYKEIR